MSNYVDAPQFMFKKEGGSKVDPLATYKLPFKTKGKPKAELSTESEP